MNDILKVQFGNNLKKYRLAQKKTQEELGFEVGACAQTICGIERGKAFPSYPLLCKIIDALAICPIDLFAIDEDEKLTSEAFKIAKDAQSLDGKKRNLLVQYLEILKSS